MQRHEMIDVMRGLTASFVAVVGQYIWGSGFVGRI